MGTSKDKITNICGIIIAVGGGLLTGHASGQYVLPTIVLTIAGILVTIAAGLVAYYNGKDGDGKAKKIL